jgi:hypothetical protein
MNSRTGKIARLPEEVRLELNHRMADGAKGPELLPWLNHLPDVRAVLTRHFGGRLINHQNLTAWRFGGYREWTFRREFFMAARYARGRSVTTSERPLSL